MKPRIGILVVAYNAEKTLAATLDRIPESLHDEIVEIIVSDDHSADATYHVGLEYQEGSRLPLTVIRQPRNLGYGGNQKAGYQLAIEHDLDIIVMLHGDGQYAPESMPDLLQPLLEGKADAVFGSRMMIKGGALKGGMPLYKFVGNKILTRFENALLGSSLSEFHAGYRAYSVEALKKIGFQRCADGFHFDTQIIIQLLHHDQRIVEVPIPTYYGDEISYVNGMAYAYDVVRDVASYRLHRAGFGNDALTEVGPEYAIKDDPDSSHAMVLQYFDTATPGTVLDLGCSGGLLAEGMTKRGQKVTGVDAVEIDGVRDRVEAFYLADLSKGLPEELTQSFDYVVMGDLIEHLADPTPLLNGAHAHLAQDGRLIASVPNFSHWYPRLRTLLGRFDYDQRGILDATHLRFYTRKSIAALLEANGFHVVSSKPTGLPLSALGVHGLLAKPVRLLSGLFMKVWPTLFGYQFVLEAERTNSI
ncbi:MAG: bifunctional glycosyltransferase/class I SAM-dependent methyltransferase [Actinomycetes bacterium]